MTFDTQKGQDDLVSDKSFVITLFLNKQSPLLLVYDLTKRVFIQAVQTSLS